MIETLRVSGHAEIISDEERLETCVIDGKRPPTGDSSARASRSCNVEKPSNVLLFGRHLSD